MFGCAPQPDPCTDSRDVSTPAKLKNPPANVLNTEPKETHQGAKEAPPAKSKDIPANKEPVPEQVSGGRVGIFSRCLRIRREHTAQESSGVCRLEEAVVGSC